jgi:hypothetical protein
MTLVQQDDRRLLKSIAIRVAKAPAIGRALLAVYRAWIGLTYLGQPFGSLFSWLVHSREVTNFTYDLTEHNLSYLASLLAHIFCVPFEQALNCLREPGQDEALMDHIWRRTRESDTSYLSDREVRFGRRLGWYAFVRILRPRVVVETGVDKGLGACLIAAALRKNAVEGYPGKYYGTDINPKAGYLLSGEYAQFGSLIYGDSLVSLMSLSEEVDLFINDSDHSPAYEAMEYKVIRSRLSSRAVVLGDNAHYTGELLAFSLAEGREFLFFQERPADHWYPGGGIGISLPSNLARMRVTRTHKTAGGRIA